MTTISGKARDHVDGGLKSVACALDLLGCFACDDELGVSTIARRLGVAKSTAHRLLTTLATRHFVERDPDTGNYRLGLRLYELGQTTAERSRLHRTAMPLLEHLRARTDHIIHLAVPDGADVVYLERLGNLAELRLLSDARRRFPVHVTASGRVIAAFNPAVAEARRRAGFQPWTSSSIKSQAHFEAMLNAVRRQGFAIKDEEVMRDLATVAAPVLDRTGRARAAISINTSMRELDGSIHTQARLIIAAARLLARDLCL